MFLGGPLASRLGQQHIAVYPAHHLFQPRRSSPQTNAEIGVLFYRKTEIKLTLKPDWDLAHREFRFPIA